MIFNQMKRTSHLQRKVIYPTLKTVFESIWFFSNSSHLLLFGETSTWLFSSLYQDWMSILFTNFFYKQHFFLTQPQCCFTFSWIEFRMLLKCCLIHINIIILRYILYLGFWGPCLGLGLFMSNFCDLFLIFSPVFIAIDHMSLKQTHFFSVHFL